MRKFKFPIELFYEINTALNGGIELGYVCDNQIEASCNEADFLNLAKSGLNLDIIFLSKYNKNVLDFMSTYEVFPYKIYKFLATPVCCDETFKTPFDIDFKTQLNITLEKKNLPKIKGKPTRVEYYEKKVLKFNEDGTPILDFLGNPSYEYSNIIAAIDFDLTYDVLGFITQKSAKLRWYREDNSQSEEFKEIGRTFDSLSDYEARIKEGIERRQSIIDNLQLPIIFLIKEANDSMSLNQIIYMGRLFLGKMDKEFNEFVKASSSITDPSSPYFLKKKAWVAIKESTETWLDLNVPRLNKTIREILLEEFEI